MRLTIYHGLTSNSMQQQQSWLIQANGIKIIIHTLRWSMDPKESWQWSETTAWPCSLLCYCRRKSPLHANSTQGTIQNTLHIIWCLLNVSNISDLLRYAWKTKRMGDTWHTNIKFMNYIFAKSKPKISTHSFQKRRWGWGGVGGGGGASNYV